MGFGDAADEETWTQRQRDGLDPSPGGGGRGMRPPPPPPAMPRPDPRDVETGEAAGVPVANPLQTATPTYCSLIPGLTAGPDSFFAIENTLVTVAEGSVEAEAIKILSQRVLQLAVVNALVAVGYRAAMLVIYSNRGEHGKVAQYSFYICLSMLILFLGVEGVRRKNPKFSCCDCGYLSTFYAIYIIMAAISSLVVLICLVSGAYFAFLIQGALLVLYASTADQTRNLLDVLYKLNLDNTNRRPPPPARGPSPFDEVRAWERRMEANRPPIAHVEEPRTEVATAVAASGAAAPVVPPEDAAPVAAPPGPPPTPVVVARVV